MKLTPCTYSPLVVEEPRPHNGPTMLMSAPCTAVDGATCMTPNTPGKIKAFYSEDAEAGQDAGADKAAAATAADAQCSSGGGRTSVASSTSAFEVLQFQQPAEPEQQVGVEQRYWFHEFFTTTAEAAMPHLSQAAEQHNLLSSSTLLLLLSCFTQPMLLVCRRRSHQPATQHRTLPQSPSHPLSSWLVSG